MDSSTTQNGESLPSPTTTDSKPNLNDSGCESLTLTPKLNEENSIETENDNKTDQEETDIDDIIILRKDPNTNRSVINKRAYLKLHRATSPTGRSANILKEKYQSNSDIETYLRSRNSFSVPGTQYNNSQDSLARNSEYHSNRQSENNIRKPKIPVPRPRNHIQSDSTLISRTQTDSTRARRTFPFNSVFSKKDENCNNVVRKNSSSSGEFITIVTRTDSEGSIDKLKSELDLFTMEEKPKDKKRSNSFRRIFSGKIFSKEKKKKDDHEPQSRVPCKENVVYSDNMKNENNAFNRHAPYRHTVGGGSNSQKDIKLYRNDSQRSMQKPNYDTKHLEQRYAQMHVNEFNQIKRNFENTRPPHEQYTRMDKPLITNNPGPVNYNKIANLSRYIDSSSSVSTLESERETLYQNEVLANAHKQYIQQQQQHMKQQQSGSLPSTKSMKYGEVNKEYNRDTPPRAQELRQDVRLVNPKALIPINSERPLPNPYQNIQNQTGVSNFRSNSHNSLRINHQQDVNSPKNPHFEETYSTVFDSVDHSHKRTNESLQRTASLRSNMKPLEPLRPPRSPSLESTKLKLPANREIVPLSPRMKSPIPQDKISTEKMIATELLKSRTPTPTRKPIAKPLSPSHQKLEIAIDYPDNVKDDRSDNNSIISEAISDRPSLPRSAKSPENTFQNSESVPRQLVSPISSIQEQYRASPISNRSQSHSSVYRISTASPIPEFQDKITTNAMVHVNSMNLHSPSETNLNHLRSLSPSARSVTPVDLRTPTSNCSQSPQKEEIRRNVEAYYWKELKRLKEQENMDLYYYQMQMMRTPNGYAEDPISTRRARSMSPTTQRNGRRSLSLPRDPKPSNQANQVQMNHYGRFQSNAIPEERMMQNQAQLVFDFNTQRFRRNAPERQTADAVARSYYNNSLYRPIFKRGSLTTPAKDSSDDGQNKRVSFSSSRIDVQNPQSWPTKNGYTQSPPQRRNTVQDDDEVFLPTNNNPQTSRLIIDGKEIYGYANKPPTYAEYQQRQNMQYQSRQNLLAQQRTMYDSPPNATYGTTKPTRESPYGPLVVANVRPQKQPNNPQEGSYGPLVVTNNRPPAQMNPQEDSPYGQPIDVVARVPSNLSRHGSMQLREPVYAQKPPLPRKMSYDTPQGSLMMRNDNQRAPRREIIMTDDIFGQFGGYVQSNGNMRYPQQQNMPQNVPRQNVGEMQPQYVQNGTRQIGESPYGYARGAPRQVSVRNKVCDMYGQIHDKNPNLTPAHQRSGVVMGQLQNPNQGMRQQSYGQLPNENFARNTRLTASANDMYRRYQNVDPRYKNEVYQNQQWQNQEDGAPNRPLPPVPADKRASNSDKNKSNETSNGTQKVKKNKKRSFFGK